MGTPYFPPSYFAPTYFPPLEESGAPAGGGPYFPAGYFPPSYFAPTYFPSAPGDGDDPDPTPASCGTDLLARGAAWLAATLPAVAGQPVVLQRGHKKTALCAAVGRTLLKLDDGFGGIRMEWTDRDFLVPTASYQIGGAPTLPKRGDTFKQTEGASVNTYQVFAPGDEPPWRWSDHSHYMLRVHTKLVATEPA